MLMSLYRDFFLKGAWLLKGLNFAIDMDKRFKLDLMFDFTLSRIIITLSIEQFYQCARSQSSSFGD